jgi:hypothetical protein
MTNTPDTTPPTSDDSTWTDKAGNPRRFGDPSYSMIGAAIGRSTTTAFRLCNSAKYRPVFPVMVNVEKAYGWPLAEQITHVADGTWGAHFRAIAYGHRRKAGGSPRPPATVESVYAEVQKGIATLDAAIDAIPHTVAGEKARRRYSKTRATHATGAAATFQEYTDRAGAPFTPEKADLDYAALLSLRGRRRALRDVLPFVRHSAQQAAADTPTTREG